VLALRPSTGGASGSFLVAADDQQRYWCKSLNNLQGPRVPVTEQIVGRLGALIGASVCRVALVRLDGVVGWEFRAGHRIEPGWAHGSAAVEPVIETRALDHRLEDDNRRRHAGFYALDDWLLGGDQQWLCATDESHAYYSHDHGFFLGGPTWSAASLAAAGAAPSALSANPTGLDAEELRRLADRLASVTEQEIETEIRKIPAEWPVTDAELAAVVELAAERRRPVAARLRALVP